MLHSTCGSVSLKMRGRKCCIFDDFSLCYSRSVTIKYATNAFAAGAPPRTPLGSSGRSPRSPSRLGRGYPLITLNPSRRLRRLDPLACRRPPMFFFYKSDTAGNCPSANVWPVGWMTQTSHREIDVLKARRLHEKVSRARPWAANASRVHPHHTMMN